MQASLLNDGGQRSAFEVEDQLEETVEPFWLRLLSLIGVIFPIECTYGKCQRTLGNIGLWLLPFVWLIIVLVMSFELQLFGSSTTLHKLNSVLLCVYLGCLTGTLSYTRKPFSEAIVTVGDRVYVNNCARLGFIVSVVLGSMYGGMYLIQSIPHGVLNFLLITPLFSMVSIVILRCLFVLRIHISQQSILLEMAQGTNMQNFRVALLENYAQVEEASAAYLQAPLAVCFTLGTANFGTGCLVFYRLGLGDTLHDEVVEAPFSFIVFALAVLSPLWVLTRIDKQYSWTLRNLLYRNIVMKETEHMHLLSVYDNIVPRAMLFGVGITRTRVATLAFGFASALIPKLIAYLRGLN